MGLRMASLKGREEARTKGLLHQLAICLALVDSCSGASGKEMTILEGHLPVTIERRQQRQDHVDRVTRGEGPTLCPPTDSVRAMGHYYALRAAEYERVYQRPERQADLRRLHAMLGAIFVGQDVLEVACGTGYWTQVIAESAKSIVATDINAEVLEIARRKDYGACQVGLVQADAYGPVHPEAHYTAGFHAFWWSHIPVQTITAFLDRFHAALPPGALVVMIDNVYVEGSSTPISRHDEEGNTYQMRQLHDGSKHEVLKNFPSSSELYAILKPWGDRVQVTMLDYYWIVQYRKKG
jgi:demethylmenaquinone methyltransferase/2-methoxy-6-polyprenyl-1,4-benzoquinol methylase